MTIPIIVYTLEQYIILSEAIATGTSKVHYGDKTIDYRSLDEMLRIQKIMYNQLFPCQNNNNGRVYFSTSKGISPCRTKRRY